jgi:hypothetical protein
MALVVADRVQETSVTSGTGTLTLAGAVAGFQTFSTAIGNSNTTFYTIYDPVAYDWEVGIGTVGAGTLARTTVLSNSAGNTTPISFAGNSKFVFCTYPAEKSINYDANGVATIGEVLGYADTGIIGSFASTVAGYNQVILQNKSTATNASSNFNVSNDAGTAGANYAELGINSSTFTGSGSFNIAGASYVASASTDLTIGTYGAYDIHFVTNSNTTDAMTIHDNGGISLGTFGNPGINNIAASKFVPGYTAITSAAGTTVLTADSNYYQNLLGSTTQTIQLPDATTLLVGTTFIFDNDSSGTLTVVDNASGPIETVPGGAASFVYLAVNATVAGTWRRHAFLPASYDFNATTANFGTATITNATWNGNTIGTGYGGTGLTTFGSANYALYSTSSSALVAGTLPVAAGGTGATTSTGSGAVVLDTSPTIASPTFTSQATFAAGTVSLPAITTTGDTNTGIFFPAADTIAFSEGGVESMRIDSAGNVLIGSTTFDDGGFSGSANGLNVVDATHPIILTKESTTGVRAFLANTGTQAYLWTPNNIPFTFGTSDTERMRIDSAGNVGIGVTPSAWGGNFAVTEYKGGFVGSQSSTYLYLSNNSYYNGTNWIYKNTAAATALEQAFGSFTFFTAASGTAGNTITWAARFSIDNSGNATAAGNVTANSDERLKTNVKTIENALDKVNQLRGVTFNKDGHENIGVIAQEIQKVLPQLVHEANDDMKTLSVAYGNIVGVLIEAVKELTEKVNKLEGK